MKSSVYALVLLLLPFISSLISQKFRHAILGFMAANRYGLAAGVGAGLIAGVPLIAGYRTIRYYPALKKQELDFHQILREL